MTKEEKEKYSKLKQQELPFEEVIATKVTTLTKCTTGDNIESLHDLSFCMILILGNLAHKHKLEVNETKCNELMRLIWHIKAELINLTSV